MKHNETTRFGAGWDYLCEKDGIAGEHSWMVIVLDDEAKVQSLRK